MADKYRIPDFRKLYLQRKEQSQSEPTDDEPSADDTG